MLFSSKFIDKSVTFNAPTFWLFMPHPQPMAKILVITFWHPISCFFYQINLANLYFDLPYFGRIPFGSQPSILKIQIASIQCKNHEIND